MSSYSQLFAQHLDTLQQRTRDILQQQGLGGLAIHSGQTHRIFLDDQDYPFKVNPQFKAWLPVLGAADGWTLQAAWSPGKEKALRICEGWRIPYADSLEQLAAQCDAVFVHTSTASHYEVVNHLLNAGVHVCVDKPLADKLSEAETLVELAAQGAHLQHQSAFFQRPAGDVDQLLGGEGLLQEIGAAALQETGGDMDKAIERLNIALGRKEKIFYQV